MKNCIFIIILVSIGLGAAADTLYPKELVKIPYSHFEKCGIDYFYVDGDSLYIMDYYNVQIKEFSMSKENLIDTYKNVMPGFGRDPMFVAKGDTILVSADPVLSIYNKKSKKYQENYYNPKTMKVKIKSIFDYFSNGKYYLYSNAGKNCYKLWDNGKIVKPDDVNLEYGLPIDSNSSFTYSNANSTITIYEGNKEKTYPLMKTGALKLVGVVGEFIVFTERKREKIGADEFWDEVFCFSLTERKVTKRIKVPQIFYAPLKNNFVVSNEKLYYLMSAKDGLYLFELAFTPPSDEKNPFEKFKYKIDPPKRIVPMRGE